MKTLLAVLTLVVESAFIIYCIYMTVRLDVLDPLPKEWLVPNMLVGAGILAFGFFAVSWLNRNSTTLPERK